jgi:hypothetical protein
MGRRSAITLAIALVACGCRQVPLVERYDHEIARICQSRIVIVDTIDINTTLATLHPGDTVYVAGTVTKPGLTMPLLRYGNIVGMPT